MLTYAEAVRALTDRGRFGIRLGLGRTRALLRELGGPQLAFRGALVGGTNGKGSVLALAGSALRVAGLRAGETPKPHLVSYRERLQIGGRPIDGRTFAALAEAVLPLADRVARRLGDPTEFELLTAMIYRWFADEAVDLALVEVGLGGRLDATHAWDGGVAVIANVDLDHMDRLGATIPLIAREKAAIILRGDLAVTGAADDALRVIRRRARRMGAPLVEVGVPPVLEVDRDGITVDLPRLGRTRVGLRGRHQAANVAVADATLDALEAAGIATVPV
ncbi:MAG: bifunctional folylpolyglutamate synthase/dihydrofolate synthase, partial [Chloroflexi bacterium]|nr:bifunctional folylpolyglutamate synthase/dihydrofolate synthase [Chloroflexota bacterium]